MVYMSVLNTDAKACGFESLRSHYVLVVEFGIHTALRRQALVALGVRFSPSTPCTRVGIGIQSGLRSQSPKGIEGSTPSGCTNGYKTV